MKVKRFASFFNFTKAPVTGFPDASFTTPVTMPLLCADATDSVAISMAAAAAPADKFRLMLPTCICFSPCVLFELTPCVPDAVQREAKRSGAPLIRDRHRLG